MFNSKFNKWAKNPDLDLFPTALEADAEAANSWIYPNINNGVYRCGSSFVHLYMLFCLEEFDTWTCEGSVEF